MWRNDIHFCVSHENVSVLIKIFKMNLGKLWVESQRAHDAIITSLWRQNVAMSFWRHSDVIFTSCVHWEWFWSHLLLVLVGSQSARQNATPGSSPGTALAASWGRQSRGDPAERKGLLQATSQPAKSRHSQFASARDGWNQLVWSLL